MNLFTSKDTRKKTKVIGKPYYSKEMSTKIINERYKKALNKVSPPPTKAQVISRLIYFIVGSILLMFILGFIGANLSDKKPPYTYCEIFIGCK